MQAALVAGGEWAKVMRLAVPLQTARREARREPTVVTVGSLTVGGGHIGVIAGPCSVESEEQIMQVAAQVKEAGATALRGGAFKPRTSPYAFQGMKETGLELLAAPRDATGLAVVTEVMTPHHVDLVSRYADVLQIGARNMQNYHLLQAAGEAPKTALLRRGPWAALEKFPLAPHYIRDQRHDHG